MCRMSRRPAKPTSRGHSHLTDTMRDLKPLSVRPSSRVQINGSPALWLLFSPQGCDSAKTTCPPARSDDEMMRKNCWAARQAFHNGAFSTLHQSQSRVPEGDSPTHACACPRSRQVLPAARCPRIGNPGSSQLLLLIGEIRQCTRSFLCPSSRLRRHKWLPYHLCRIRSRDSCLQDQVGPQRN